MPTVPCIICAFLGCQFFTIHISLDFCPADCDWQTEISCKGEYDDFWNQLSEDFCLPQKTGECPNHCPMRCGKDQVLCPGKMDHNGCQIQDTCTYESNNFNLIPTYPLST